MQIVYIRIVVYALSLLLGMIPAAWAGFVSYDQATGILSVSVEGLVTAAAGALAVSGGVFAKWGTR